MKFDPMTGEPIKETTQEVKPKTVTKYDPMTGEPIQVVVEETPQESAPVQNNQPLETVKTMAKNFVHNLKTKPALAAIVGVVAVAAVVIIAVASGLFMSDRDRVANAIVNTINDQGELGNAMMTFEKIYTNKEHTTTGMVEYSGVEVRAEYRHTKADKQLWAALDGIGMPDLEGTVTLTDSQVLAYTPLLEDVLFVYNYTKNNDGYITEQVPEQSLELINQSLSIISGTEDEQFEIAEEHIKALKEWYNDIEVEKVKDKEEFEINGKDKNCTGYEVEITEDMLCDLIDIMADISDDANSTDVDMDVYFDELKDELSGMPDMEMIFYLDSNKLAAIVIDVDGAEMEILFKGGKYRMQNMEVEVEGRTIMEIEGETEGKVETVKVEIGGQKFFEYEYDAKSGDFEAVVMDYYGDEVAAIEVNIEVKGSAVNFTDGTVEVDGSSVDFELSAKKGATIEKLSGEEFDLGDASYSDINEIMEELYDELN